MPIAPQWLGKTSLVTASMSTDPIHSASFASEPLGRQTARRPAVADSPESYSDPGSKRASAGSTQSESRTRRDITLINRFKVNRHKCDQSGMTIIEVVTSLALVSIALYLSIYAMSAMLDKKALARRQVDMGTIRRTLVATLQNDDAWSRTLQANPGMFSCLLTSSAKESDPDCRPLDVPGGVLFPLYNSQGDLVFDSTVPTNGLTDTGEPCTTFDAINGNRECPYRVELRWRPICPAAPETCRFPLIEISGDFSIGGSVPDATFRIRPAHLKIRLTRPTKICTSQTIDVSNPANWDAFGTAIPPAPRVTNGELNNYNAANYLRYRTDIVACNPQSLTFIQRIAVIPPRTVADASNQASICIADTTAGNACLFEWRQTQDEWSLWRRSSTGSYDQVYTKTAANPPPFTSGTQFRFVIDRGLVKFYVNDTITYIFDRPWFNDYTFKIIPAPANYSSGIDLPVIAFL